MQEELAKTKEQMALMEKSKANVLQDLARSKRQIEDLSAKLQEVNEVSKSDRLRADEIEHVSFKAVEDWQTELQSMKERYDIAMQDLHANKQAMESLKHELNVCIEAKDEAVRLAGEAMNAAELTAKRVKELSAELLASLSSIISENGLSKMDDLMHDLSCDDRDIHSLENDSILLDINDADLHRSNQETELESSDAYKKVEMQLKDAKATIQDLELELASVKGECTSSSAKLKNAIEEVSVARSEAETLKHDLAKAQAFESELKDAKSALEKKQIELDEAKSPLTKAVEDTGILQSELAILKKELDLAQSFEAQLKDTNFTLEKLQSELLVSRESENRSQSRIHELTAMLERLQTELSSSNEAEKESKLQLIDMRAMMKKMKEMLKFMKQ